MHTKVGARSQDCRMFFCFDDNRCYPDSLLSQRFEVVDFQTNIWNRILGSHANMYRGEVDI